ncbi:MULTISPECIES: GAP family protein [unclassified Streptomyces]|uniref:GAP family protein n=1 Tax=unclassified Streptomyces TaxID=2593676 RepID=UPI002E0DE3DF|nr:MULTISPECIES: GAP family protein [unclassified Streptomyces]WSR24299.1 GAP family protein [Streptomyces sp. NBC_01205]
MVLDLMLIALAITLDPLPLMAFALVVSSARGVWKGLAFILAWLACFVAVIAAVLALTDGEPLPPRSPPGVAGLAAKLAIGIGLVFYGLHRRRLMRGSDAVRAGAAADGAAPPAPEAHEDSADKVAKGLDGSSIWAVAGLAVLVQPWGMVAAGATTVLEANTSHASTYAALFGFCLLATASLLAAELYIVFAPEVAQARLLRLRGWLKDHSQQAIVVICLVLGLYLTGKSIYQLTG